MKENIPKPQKEKKEGTIGVFFGGKSPEHDVSIITGQLILSGLKKMGRKVVPIYVAKNGEWYVSDKLASMEFFKTKDYEKKLKLLPRYTIDFNKSQGKIVFWRRALKHREEHIHIAFPAFHGPNGEDGTVQGIFELTNIPYIGCGVMSSAVAMDKVTTKMLLQEHDIPTPRFVYATNLQWKSYRQKVLEHMKSLGFPIFIKPARIGSSIGIAKVIKEEELEQAIDVAFHYDTKVIAEKGVDNLMDLTVCVLGNDNPLASEIQESIFDDDFFSYDDKYLVDGGAQIGNADKKIIIPAEVPKMIEQQIKQMAQRVFAVIDGAGIARVDFLYDKISQQFYVNEVNPLPGTLYHHLWDKSGVPFSELLNRLVDLAFERHEEKQHVTHSFDSTILDQVGGPKGGSKLSG